jgi:putative aldouronate transport system permease protein
LLDLTIPKFISEPSPTLMIAIVAALIIQAVIIGVLILKERKRWSKDYLINQFSYHLMLTPAVVILTIFSYLPLYGITIAFKKFKPREGIFGSPWNGLDNFKRLLLSSDIDRIFANTVFIAVMKIAAGIIIPLLFALLLNEIRKKLFVRTVQTLVYMPHFLSWVIVSGILLEILNPNRGFVNNFIVWLGFEPIYFLGESGMFPYLLVATDSWKNFGYGTIIYLAALTSIDPTLYEAAIVDGANRLRQLWHVTLPGIINIVILVTVLSLGGVLDAGFDQVFNLINPLVYSTGEILDLTVYRLGIEKAQFSLGAAVGLLKSVIAFFLIIISYRLAYKLTGYKIF